jgi:hypothetical protein
VNRAFRLIIILALLSGFNLVNDGLADPKRISTMEINEISASAMAFDSSQGHPNPFASLAIIEFNLAQAGFVNLTIFDSNGRRIATLINELCNAGSQSVTYDASRFKNGAYVYTMKTEGFSRTKNFVLPM